MFNKNTHHYAKVALVTVAAAGGVLAGAYAFTAHNANAGSIHTLFPNELLVSRSVYDNNPANVVVGETELPPNCSAPSGSCTTPPTTAGYDGTYPAVFNNDAIDGSFGITSKIFLDQVTPYGFRMSSTEVPNSLDSGITSSSDQLVTSFSSKSELALNLSLDHKYVTFMGYVAPVNAIDVSNSNTPGVVDPTNPVGENYYRAAAIVDRFGNFSFTETNAYSGNNGRAIILNDAGGDDFLYSAGNAGNGKNPQPDGIILGAGAQFIAPEDLPESQQDPGQPAPVGSFNVTQLGLKKDKIGKDTNFRGLTIFNNVVYYSKGSGSNGINTVYFIDTTGNACPSTSATPGVGLPQSGATLPAQGIDYIVADLQSEGVVPYNMCILKGFPTVLASSASSVNFPFGIWFANANTVYIADEGNGDNTYSTASGTYTTAAGQTLAGLEKWTFNSTTQQWNLAYTLQNGLNLGVPYTVYDYPTGDNAATGLPWAPGTDGLRNLTGTASGKDMVTIYAITSTVSGNGDQGADPNKLMKITDQLSATTLPSWEKFTTLRSAGNLEVLRGVSFTPGSNNY